MKYWMKDSVLPEDMLILADYCSHVSLYLA